jgi:hypothetical protein
VSALTPKAELTLSVFTFSTKSKEWCKFPFLDEGASDMYSQLVAQFVRPDPDEPTLLRWYTAALGVPSGRRHRSSGLKFTDEYRCHLPRDDLSLWSNVSPCWRPSRRSLLVLQRLNHEECPRNRRHHQPHIQKHFIHDRQPEREPGLHMGRQWQV